MRQATPTLVTDSKRSSSAPPPSESDGREPAYEERADRDKEDRERRRLERLLPEVIKRVVEAGVGKLTEGPENVRQFVGEMKLPKEVLSLILAQFDEIKNGLYRVVAKEVRDFLEHTNFADEVEKVLTSMAFEIKTEIRFVPREGSGGSPKPDVRSKVSIKRERRSTVPPGRGSEPPPSVPAPPSAAEGTSDRERPDDEEVSS